MFVDLDRFKTVNDSLGHAVGDVLLREVATRLVKQLRTGDTICRIGGDEFMVVLPEVKRSSHVAQVAQKIIEQLSQPVTVEERELTVTPSIGIAVFTGMLSSTCIGTLVVPAFFVVVQRLSERLGERIRTLPSALAVRAPVHVGQPLQEETQA